MFLSFTTWACLKNEITNPDYSSFFLLLFDIVGVEIGKLVCKINISVSFLQEESMLSDPFQCEIELI